MSYMLIHFHTFITQNMFNLHMHQFSGTKYIHIKFIFFPELFGKQIMQMLDFSFFDLLSIATVGNDKKQKGKQHN